MILDTNSKTLLINSWTNDNNNLVIQTIGEAPITNLVLDCSDEYEPPGGFNGSFFLDLITTCSKKNIKVDIMLGSKENKFYNRSIYNLTSYCTFYFFPLNFITTHTNKFIESKNTLNNNESNLKHLFYILSNTAKEHRALFVDLLYKYKLNYYGYHTWNNLTVDTPPYKHYNFRYWKEQIIKDEDSFKNDSNSTPPDRRYFESLLDIVLETTTDTIFITEKTLRPLVYEKPFIVFAAPGFHMFLEEIGFKLYSELFDYSFDSIDNDQLRAEVILEQVRKLQNTGSYEQIYRKVADKLVYNYLHLVYLSRTHFYDRVNFLSNISTDIHRYTSQLNEYVNTK